VKSLAARRTEFERKREARRAAVRKVRFKTTVKSLAARRTEFERKREARRAAVEEMKFKMKSAGMKAKFKMPIIFWNLKA
jgi:hypothetical protein